ncbi:MAG TPA: hypothetical protein VF631_06930 [Allosphingosinicella sp.]|jgi:hypothetical protein|uniref:hypothetical protein n=1 Tax=Allosphingosinicella sp. TaxID=2823234 RepID=UPI002F27E0AE
MAKGKSSKGGKAGDGSAPPSNGYTQGASNAGQDGQSSGTDRIPASLREFGEKAVELANNPIARSMLAAGLVTAAAALTANQKTRDSARKAASGVADATEEAAENARRIGAALVSAATESFQKMFSGAGGSPGETGAGQQANEAELPLSTPRSGGGASSAGKERGGGGTQRSAASSSGKAAGGGSGKAGGGKAKTTGEGSSGSSGKKGGRKKGGAATNAGA